MLGSGFLGPFQQIIKCFLPAADFGFQLLDIFGVFVLQGIPGLHHVVKLVLPLHVRLLETFNSGGQALILRLQGVGGSGELAEVAHFGLMLGVPICQLLCYLLNGQ